MATFIRAKTTKVIRNSSRGPIEDFMYQILYFDQNFSEHRDAPTQNGKHPETLPSPLFLVNHGTEELRVHLSEDLDRFPFAWFRELLSQFCIAEKLSHLRNVKLYLPCLSRPFITDLVDEPSALRDFRDLLQLFFIKNIELTILFWDIGGQEDADTTPHCFRSIDVSLLSQALLELSHMEYTETITFVLGKESRVNGLTNSGVNKRYHHQSTIEDDELL